MKILFFIRVNEDGVIKRNDFRDIIAGLCRRGDDVEIYDTATSSHFRVRDDGSTDLISGRERKFRLKPLLLIYRLLNLYLFSAKNAHRYDISHFCYIREEFLILPRSLKKVALRNIITVFGSDVGKRNMIKRLFKRFVYNADIITITATNGRALLMKHFRYRKIEDRIIQLPLPLLIMKEISSSELSKKEAKTMMGFNPDDLIVVCGSVLSPNEQYEKWVPLLNAQPCKDRNIVFVFPFTYGDFSLFDEYKKLIERHIPAGNFKILTGWMDDSDVVRLRKATDILVNLRKTDQFAGIIMESVYTGAAVIVAGWLGYSYYTENDYLLYRVNQFSDLPVVLGEAINDSDKPEIIQKLIENSGKMGRDFSYGKLMNDWDLFYERLRM